MFQNILVAIDGSPDAEQALTQAVDLAESERARLTIFSAVVMPPTAAYIGGPCAEAFIEPTAVNASLPDMPLFLTTEVYIPVPLEATYQSAWEAVPEFWRNVLTDPAGS